MNRQLLNSILVLLYLAIGTTGIALLVGWARRRFGPPQITAPRQKHLKAQPASGALEFTDVIPKVQSLLSSSQPALRLKNVLVPLDFSESSLRALPYAALLASQFGCRVTLLYVVHLNIADEERGVSLACFVAKIESAAHQKLVEVALSVSATARNVVRVGEPVSEVLKEVAESDIDLVIIGEPRRNGLWRRLLPTVESRIRHRVPCPTLVAL